MSRHLDDTNCSTEEIELRRLYDAVVRLELGGSLCARILEQESLPLHALSLR